MHTFPGGGHWVVYSAHVGIYGGQHIVCTMHMAGSILWANGVHMHVYIVCICMYIVCIDRARRQCQHSCQYIVCTKFARYSVYMMVCMVGRASGLASPCCAVIKVISSQ